MSIGPRCRIVYGISTDLHKLITACLHLVRCWPLTLKFVELSPLTRPAKTTSGNSARFQDLLFATKHETARLHAAATMPASSGERNKEVSDDLVPWRVGRGSQHKRPGSTTIFDTTCCGRNGWTTTTHMIHYVASQQKANTA